MYRKKDKHVIKSLKRNRYCGAKIFYEYLSCLRTDPRMPEETKIFAKVPLLANPMAVIHEEQGTPKTQCDKLNS